MKLQLVKKEKRDVPVAASGQWGLFDTVDGVWMGTDEGPRTYEDHMLARCAAEMVDVQLGQRTGRTQVKEYLGGATHLRDQVDTKMSAEQALGRLENGFVN